MKKVFSNSREVWHLWAHQVQTTGRAGHVSFEGKSLYSYSTSIAQIEVDRHGQPWAFFSESSFSQTTAKHLSDARRAAVHLNCMASPAFRYGGGRYTVQELLRPIYSQLETLFLSLPRLRSNLPYQINRYNEKKALLYKALDAFGVTSIPKDLPETANLKESAKALQALHAEKARLKEEQAEKARQEQLKKDEKTFKQWLKTGEGSCPRSYSNKKEAYLTIRGELVITSQGASAPIDHVKKALAFYDSRKTGKKYAPYKTNDPTIHLGHFKLDEILESGDVRAGCHLFTAKEISRFRKQHKNILEGGAE